MRSKYCLLMLPAAAVVLSSCSIIDEDNSDCGLDNKIVYRLKLRTNIQTELETQLGTEEERPVAQALSSSLSGIFTDWAHDISLSFYDTDDKLYKTEKHTMDASQAEYVVYLPERDYRNLVVANIADAENIRPLDDTHPDDMKLQYDNLTDTLNSHTTGLFTARQVIEVCGCTETYYVDLYMANSCAALVVDTTGVDIRGMKVFTQDFATSFAVADSIYAFTANPVVRSTEIPLPGQHRTCHYAVSFPSRNNTVATASAVSQAPARADSQAETLFRIKAYITLPDGSVTENIISVEQPLLAGYLKIIKMKMKQDGSLTPESHDVGVSVTLDWKQGGTYEPDI